MDLPDSRGDGTEPVADDRAGDEARSLVAAPPAWLRLGAGWAWRLALLAIVALALVWLSARLLVVTLPFVIALVLATLCWPPRDWLVRRGVPSAASATIVVIGGLLALVGIFAAIGPGFVDQVAELGAQIQQGTDAVLVWLDQSPLGIDIDVDQLLEQARSMMVSGATGGALVGNVLSGLSTAGQFLAGLALTIVLLFFIVKDGDMIVAWVSGLLSARHRPTASALGQRAWTALSGYVRGTATIALIDAIGIGIGLLILGVPLVLPLMLLVFFGAFLPVVGAFLAGLVAVLVALADGGIVTGLLALGVVLLVQQLEGNFLHPTIMHRAVALHPIVVLLALGAGATLAGIVGAFLAVPITAVAAAVGNELRLRGRAGMLSGQTAGGAPSKPLGGRGGSLDHEVDDAAEAATDPAARQDRALDLEPGGHRD